MLSQQYRTQLEQYIKDNSISEEQAKILKQGNNGDVFYLVEKGMSTEEVIKCIKANLECSRRLREDRRRPFSIK